MPIPSVPDDGAREWCPYCREYHTGESVEALVDMIEQLCAGGEAA